MGNSESVLKTQHQITIETLEHNFTTQEQNQLRPLLEAENKVNIKTADDLKQGFFLSRQFRFAMLRIDFDRQKS